MLLNKLFSKTVENNHIIYRILCIKFYLKNYDFYKQFKDAIKIQDAYDLTELKNTKKLILFLISSPDCVMINDGIISTFSLCEESRRINEDALCIISTQPHSKYTYAKNDKLSNNEIIYRFSQIVDNAQNLDEMILHIPEYCIGNFYNTLTEKDVEFLKSIGNLHINIVNQNIELMLEPAVLKDLYKLTNNITLTIAHNKNATQEVCDKWQIPTHLFPGNIDLSRYKACEFEEKERIIEELKNESLNLNQYSKFEDNLRRFYNKNYDFRPNLKPKLTVIVVTYNHCKYIARCLDSILSQKTNFDFVITVVDDCSTDGTSDIIREYASKYTKKINPIIREKNLGVVDSVYPVLCDVDSEYYFFIDGDDFCIDNNKFQMQVDALDKHKDCSICAHKTKVIDLKKNNVFYIGLEDNKESQQLNIYNTPYLHVSSRMYRNIIDYKNEDKKIVWDNFHFYKLLSKGDCYYIDRTMSCYYRDGNGMDSNMDDNKSLISNMILFYELDLFLNFKYTKIFRKYYLPELCRHDLLKRWDWKIPRLYRFIQKMIWK